MKKRILMLDDDQDVLDMVAASFAPVTELEVMSATTSEGALALAEGWCPDILLTDVRLSPLDPSNGIDVALTLAETMTGLQVIIMSGTMKDVDDRIGEMDPLRFRFLPKPFLPSTLTEMVKRCL